MSKRKGGKKASSSAARVKKLWFQAEQLAAAGKLAEEERVLRTILDLAPGHYVSLLKLSYIAWKAEKAPVALDFAKRAVQANYGDAQGHLMLGKVLVGLGLTDLAEAELTIASQLDPADPRIFDTLGLVLMQQGRSAEAEAAYRRAITLAPDAVVSFYNLAANKKFQPGDPDIAVIEKLCEKEGLSQGDKVFLHFTLGKIYHDCGEYDRAFAEVEQANAIQREQVQYRTELVQELIEQMIQAVDAGLVERLRDVGDTAESPVFVIGMSRSGTTLVESLLSRHPQISGIGEVPYMLNLAQGCGQRLGSSLPYPQFLAELSPAFCSQLGEEYVQLTRQFGVDAARIVDKTPGNFLFVGFILALLPKAKIIHCVRNPVDTCLSNYQQLFASGGMSYTYDQKELGEYYVQYQHIMDHWQSLFPGQILNIAYEDVVADSEQAQRQMIDYCGLRWDDHCLEALGKDFKIRTASVWQARQPVYRSSVERWRHYEKHLGPLLEALQPVLAKGTH